MHTTSKGRQFALHCHRPLPAPPALPRCSHRDATLPDQKGLPMSETATHQLPRCRRALHVRYVQGDVQPRQRHRHAITPAQARDGSAAWARKQGLRAAPTSPSTSTPAGTFLHRGAESAPALMLCSHLDSRHPTRLPQVSKPRRPLRAVTLVAGVVNGKTIPCHPGAGPDLQGFCGHGHHLLRRLRAPLTTRPVVGERFCALLSWATTLSSAPTLQDCVCP